MPSRGWAGWHGDTAAPCQFLEGKLSSVLKTAAMLLAEASESPSKMATAGGGAGGGGGEEAGELRHGVGQGVWESAEKLLSARAVPGRMQCGRGSSRHDEVAEGPLLRRDRDTSEKRAEDGDAESRGRVWGKSRVWKQRRPFKSLFELFGLRPT